MPDGFVPPECDENVDLIRDVGMDSLALVSLMVICEQELGVRLSDDPDVLTKLTTLDGAVDYLLAHASASISASVSETS